MQNIYRFTCLMALVGMLVVLPGSSCIPGGIVIPNDNGSDGNNDNNGSTDDNPDVDITGFADQVIQLVNTRRAADNLPALAKNDKLMQASQDYAERMAAKDFVSSVDPYNSSLPGDRAEQAGYAFGYLAENLSSGYSSPQAVFDNWMTKKSASDNILWTAVSDTGVGVAKNSKGTVYWVQMFASPK